MHGHDRPVFRTRIVGDAQRVPENDVGAGEGAVRGGPSREAVATLSLDDVLHGNRRGPLPLRWVYLHVLRELAQHCGHADILREQIRVSDEEC